MRNRPGGPWPFPRVGILVVLAALMTTLVGAESRASDEQTVASEHFTITWSENQSGFVDPTDVDRDGTPDAIETTLLAFEEAWAFQIDGLGYRPPPGEGRYRLYAASGAEAQILPAEPEPTPSPSGGDDEPVRSRPSYILFPVGKLENEKAIQTLAAHEFHHAIQAGYDFAEDSWIEEATSTWVANLLVPPTPETVAELRDFIPQPRASLFSTGGLHEYGAFLFLQFLVERYGAGDPAIVREMWEQMAVPEGVPGAPDLDSREAIEAVLEAHGVGTADAWSEFQLWRWRLEKFADGAVYSAALQPDSWRRVSVTTPVETETCRLEAKSLPPLSGDYVRLRPPAAVAAGATARFSVVGPPDTAAFLLLKRKRQPPEERKLVFDEQGVASTIVGFGSETRALTAGLSNGSVLAGSTIGYSLRFDGAPSQVEAMTPRVSPEVTFGKVDRMTGSITCAGSAARSASVAITETEDVSGDSVTYIEQTDSTGTWGLGIVPQANATYQVQVIDPLLTSATSDTVSVKVRVFVEMVLDRLRVRLGEPVHVSGIVRPSHPDVDVLIEHRRPEGTWEPGPTTTTAADGSYALDLVLPRSGVWEVRARVPDTEDLDHIPGESAEQTVEVED